MDKRMNDTYDYMRWMNERMNDLNGRNEQYKLENERHEWKLQEMKKFVLDIIEGNRRNGKGSEKDDSETVPRTAFLMFETILGTTSLWI
ncbi:12123_t:CDS:2 [Rhizophagus irregularis]|nr:12123_t:CDS:2 [Rhizophagus irregularis]